MSPEPPNPEYLAFQHPGQTTSYIQDPLSSPQDYPASEKPCAHGMTQARPCNHAKSPGALRKDWPRSGRKRMKRFIAPAGFEPTTGRLSGPHEPAVGRYGSAPVPAGPRASLGYSYLGGEDRTSCVFARRAFRPMKSGLRDVSGECEPFAASFATSRLRSPRRDEPKGEDGHVAAAGERLRRRRPQIPCVEHLLPLVRPGPGRRRSGGRTISFRPPRGPGCHFTWAHRTCLRPAAVQTQPLTVTLRPFRCGSVALATVRGTTRIRAAPDATT